MKILYASERPPFPFFLGGAARSAHYLLSALGNSFDIECRAVGSKMLVHSGFEIADPKELLALGVTDLSTRDSGIALRCGYTIEVLDDFYQNIGILIDEFDPDVVWTQLDGLLEIARLATKRRKKVVVFLRDAEDSPALLRSLALIDCRMVCNSEFMRRRLKKLTGVDASVIYPPLEGPLDVKRAQNGFITMINPHRVKGLDVFLEIASRFGSERFLVVESWVLEEHSLLDLRARLASLPNVTFQRRVANIAVIFKETKLLLVPSLWEEAFGRVVIEAQSCGIPVIASQRGGLPEAVGDGGLIVRDFRNGAAWEDAINRVLSDPDYYAALSDRALRHAELPQFTLDEAARRFLAVCSNEPGPSRYFARAWKLFRWRLEGWVLLRKCLGNDGGS